LTGIQNTERRHSKPLGKRLMRRAVTRISFNQPQRR
jgi:hypothetical protein